MMYHEGALIQDHDDPGGARSTSLVLHDAELQLRRRADRMIKHALSIGALLLAGWKAVEIRERLVLTKDEYRSAHEWLGDALKQAGE